ncbi:MAG: 2-oxoacid ferredoxin oxidoreductase [Candidatus Marinimicrobia bacterium]|nr:2-oxoacid ferredoxin oxidoreductase [Candidatus Neomarinimicrobiota bacterium]
MKPEELNTPHDPTWCPACGNFGIWVAMKKAITELKLDPDEVAVSYGIGCSGNENNFVKTYAFHSLHGRAVPPAAGIKFANDALTVIAVSGDGDAYGEGGNHFVHACKNNYDITYLVHDNQMYSLTTGQASPTSEKGMKTKTTPSGIIEDPINPISLALAANATFVARGFSGKADHLAELIKKAIQHKGFALVDILQNCVTFNKLNTFQFFNKRVYDMNEGGYKTDDKQKAHEKALEWGERIPIGIFYQEEKPSYNSSLPQNADAPLVKHELEKVNLTPNFEGLA